MISLEYVLVRSESDGPKLRSGAQPSAMGPVETVITVETISATTQDVTELAADDATLVAAPLMPLRLVEPIPSVTQGVDGDTCWGIAAVGADRSPFDGSGVTVAVLDTGVDSSHPAFSDVDVVQRDFTGEGNGDIVGHGTHCAGTIVGADVAGQRIGVARGVERLLAAKVLGSEGGGTGILLDAISWAISEGAQVISMSLGIDFPGMVDSLREAGVHDLAASSMALAAYRDNIRAFDAIAAMALTAGPFGRGAVICAASGNESRRGAGLDASSSYTIDAEPPASSDGIISVGAVSRSESGNFEVAWFSNANPDVVGPGVEIQSAAVEGGLKALSGTSMATPHVAGVAALWVEKLQLERAFTVQAVQARLLGRGERAGLPFGDVGNGLVRAPEQ